MKLDIYEMIAKIQKLLDENHIWGAMVYRYSDTMPVIVVEIDDGDWKHDHWRADWLIEENFGLHLFSEQTIGESDSDTYSSVHNYIYC